MTRTGSDFWRRWARPARKTGWQVHAYCLMPNHFHLVVETPQPNLVAGMKWLLGTYTVALQPAAQGVRAFVQRPLQGVDRGRQRATGISRRCAIMCI